MSSQRFRLAVPNKGRLQEPTLRLLRDAGLVFDSPDRALLSQCENSPIDILFVRTEDVAEFVNDGVAEAGVTATNLLAESGQAVPIVARLGFGRCRLDAALPVDAPGSDLDALAGLRLATAHPHATERFFRDRGIPVEIVPISGAVEVAPRMGLADGIVDLVSSGTTLLVNGLRSVGTLLESEAVLVAGTGTTASGDGVLDQLCTMLEAVVAGRRKKYVMMNAPRSALPLIEEILPGLDSPSILPLAHEWMVAVHAVVDADEVWRLLAPLRAAGASGILVVPIEKLVP
jgi:ATP phosphoribosyltransferase